MEPIKNGLKCWLEGADVTNSSTTWKDRSGNNNNFSITGSLTTENNMAVFSGSQYAKINNLNIEHGTIEITAAYDNGGTSVHGFGSWESNKYKFTFGSYIINLRKKSNPISGAGSWDLMALQNIQYGDIVTYGLSYNESSFSVFCNGKIIATGVSSEIASITSFYLGLKSDYNTKHAGKIKSLRIYNRKLEYHEILANYQYELLDRNNNLYVNDNNLPKIVEKLSDASNIKITGNEYGNRVQTVIDKIVEKADNVTKAISQEVINNTHSFKAGIGNNVNVSSDVQVQDSFSEIAIKGQTYQNLYPKLNINNYQNKTGAIQFDRDIIKFVANGAYQNIFLKKESLIVKSSTTYTLVIDVLKNTIVNTQSDSMLYLLDTAASNNRELTYFNEQIVLKKNTAIGRYKFKVTTKSDLSVASYASRCFLTIAATSGELWIKYSLIEGDHTNNPNLPSYFEGIVGVGDKSKNLLNPANFVSSNGVSITKKNMLEINLASDGGQRTIYKGLKIPKGQYTVTIEVIEGQYTGGNLIFYNSSDNKFSEVRVPGTHVVNTNNNDIDKLTLWAIKGVCKLRIQIEKGSVSTPYEPYYNGYKVEILSCGKNLYKPNLQTKNARGLTFSLYGNKLFVDGTSTDTVDFRPINGTEKITLDLFNYVNKLPIGTTLRLSNNLGLKNYFSLKRNGVQTYPSNTLVIQEGDYDISCFVRFENGQTYKNQELKIQLEISSNANEFEPYQENKIQIFLDEPLMKLPNDVCDEITRDGKLIKRIGKIVLDGSNDEKWHIHDNKTNKRFRIYWTSNSNKYSQPAGWCNIIPFYENKKWQDDVELIELDTNYISIRKPFGTVEEFRAYLKANPVTVYYELQTPIVTDLSETQIKIFKGGYVTFNTFVTPESIHVVQLNKSAQIQNTIKQSQLLDNKIAVLENNYDSLMLSTLSTLNDLEFDYTLK